MLKTLEPKFRSWAYAGLGGLTLAQFYLFRELTAVLLLGLAAFGVALPFLVVLFLYLRWAMGYTKAERPPSPVIKPVTEAFGCRSERVGARGPRFYLLRILPRRSRQ